MMEQALPRFGFDIAECRPICCREEMIRGCLLMIVLCAAFSSASARAGKHKGIYFEAKGKGPAVILVHGGQMDRRMWDFQFDGWPRIIT